jgi:hypothetical protein
MIDIIRKFQFMILPAIQRVKKKQDEPVILDRPAFFNLINVDPI